MVVMWPCMKQVVSPCPRRHNKAKLVFEVCKFDHKSDEVPVACTNEVHKNDESRKAVEPVDDAYKASN